MYKKAGGGWRMSKEAVDGLQYHFDNAIPLRESVYRPGSKSFFEMFELARALYEHGVVAILKQDRYKQGQKRIGMGSILDI